MWQPTVLHLDEAVVVIDKPSGLVVHRSERALERTTCLGLVRNALGRRVYPVHRLDRGCSGALALALDPVTARRLSEAFASRLVEKSYLAVVRGFAPQSGVVDRPLKDENGALQPASTRFTRVDLVELPRAVGRYSTARYSLVRAVPETGRFHQLRRHLAGLGYPILGDSNHGDLRHNRFLAESFGARRLLLHAEALAFPHPRESGRVEVEAPPSGVFRRLCERFGWPFARPGRPAA